MNKIMTDDRVFFSKYAVLNVLAFHLANVYLTYYVPYKEVLHLNWPFGVAFTLQPFLCPFFSLCFVFSK